MTLFEPDAGRRDSLFPYDLDTLPLTPLDELLIPRELAPGVISYPIPAAELADPDPEPEPETTTSSGEARELDTSSAAAITARLAARAGGRTAPLPARHHEPEPDALDLDDPKRRAYTDPIPGDVNAPELVAARRQMFADLGWTTNKGERQ